MQRDHVQREPQCSISSMADSLGESTVESLLRSIADEEKAAFLSQWLTTELQHRSLAGESMSESEFVSRFPEFEDVVRDAFQQLPPPAQTRYHPVSLHRSGGLGQVWRARDINLNRDVAIKKLHAEIADNPELRRRFLREALITAKLQHPNIVPIHSLEITTHDGDPHYAMRFVEGKTLREEIATLHEADGFSSGGLRRLLGVFLNVCNAVRFAHAECVIHRDLKPENVLVGDFGEVVVLDWGLAKSFREGADTCDSEPPQDLALNDLVDALLTQPGAYLGTPAYSAPEQADPAAETDARTDIYGLGAILYEILTGKPPTPDGLKGRDQEVPTPREINSQVPAALGSIASKALRLKADERYTKIESLAADVESWLADKPVSTHRDSIGERAARWLRKHRRTAMATMAVTVGIAIVSTAAAFVVNNARQAEQQRSLELERLVYINDVRDAGVRIKSGDFETAHRLLERCPEHLRGWEWRHCRGIANQVRAYITTANSTAIENFISSCRYLPDGRLLVGATGEEPRIGVLKPGQNKVTWRTTNASTPGQPTPIDSTRSLFIDQQGLAILGAKQPDPNKRLHDGVEMVLSVSNSGNAFAFRTSRGPQRPAQHWVAAADETLRLNGPELGGCMVTDDLVVGYSWQGFHVWRHGQAEPTHNVELPEIRNIAVSPDSKKVICQVPDGLQLFDLTDLAQEPSPRRRLPMLSTQRFSLAFSRDSGRLAVADGERVTVWDIVAWRKLAELGAAFYGLNGNDILELAFAPNGNEIAMRSFESVTVWAWDAEYRVQRRLTADALDDATQHDNQLICIGADSADGGSSRVLRYDVEGDRHETLGRNESRPAFVEANSRWLATSFRNQVVVVDRTSGQESVVTHGDWLGVDFEVQDGRPNATRIAISSKSVLATAATDITYHHHLLGAAAAAEMYTEHEKDLQPSGERPFAEFDRPVYAVALWDLESLERKATLVAHDRLITDMAFTATGDRLLTASRDGTVRIWDAETGGLLRTFRGHATAVYSVAVAANGRLAASGEQNGEVCCWEIETGKIMFRLDPHAAAVHSLAFSPDSSRLASAGLAEGIQVWEMNAGREILAADTLGQWPRSLGFTSGGELYGIVGQGDLWVWRSQAAPRPFIKRPRRNFRAPLIHAVEAE